jgi:hypothetical protein
MTSRRALRPLRRLAERIAGRAGYDLTRRHFYSPIPNLAELPTQLWDGPSEMPGVDLRIEDAIKLLNGPLLPFLSEFQPRLRPSASGGFWLHNGSYESVDANLLYAILRHLRPRRVYELGSGVSSHVIDLASVANEHDGKPLEHTIFDPFPYQNGTMGPVLRATAHAVRTEDLDPSRFDALQAGDVLFVDTTHTVRTGGDVTHIFLEILPRLVPGVTVHVHDIFLPYEYPKDWVVDDRRAWAEQYLLQAFLAFNDAFEVMMPNYAVARAAPDMLKGIIQTFDPQSVRPGGFWIKRTL